MSKSSLPVFSSRSLIVCCLTVRCLVHFEGILVYDVRECSDLIVLYMAVQFSQQHLWADCLSPLYIPASFVVD